MNATEKKELITQIENLRDKGQTVEQACQNVGVSAQTYYLAKRGGNKSTKKKSPKAASKQSYGNVSKNSVLGALYGKVDFKTFQSIESSWV